VIDAVLRSALDCSTLESSSFDLLGKDQPLRLMGKTYLPHGTWSKQVIGFNLALGWAAKKLLGRLARNGLRQQGLHLGRFLRKPNSFRSSSFSPEMTLVASSRPCDLNLSEFPVGDPLCEDRSGGGSSLVKSVPPFVFPPLPNAEMSSPATCGCSSGIDWASVWCRTLCLFCSFSLSGASELGKKIRSSPSPLLQSCPFQQYFRRARELRAGHSVLWNDGFLSDSLEASKLSAEPVLFKDMGGEFHANKKTESPAKKGIFRKGFLNLPPIVSVPPVLPREVKDVGVVRPSSPPSGCISPCSVEGNRFSQSRNWPVGFDHNGEIVVWEEEEDDYWDGLPLDWALEGAFGEEVLAIRDAMEEDFQWEKMIERQKSKGKRELLNLHSSINYGDAKVPSRSRKGKAHMM